MQQLNKETFIQRTASGEALMALPERILQFGNGVLLRGLPDYYVDLANKKGIFNGRIVVVKTTAGNTEDFKNQNYLYTHRIKGIQNGQKVDETLINASISRLLSATDQWPTILACAENPAINIVFSNTTEQGFVYSEENISDSVPSSFPGKLLAYLFHRYQSIGEQEASKICIIPTELVENNGDKLRSFLKKLSKHNDLPTAFQQWMEEKVWVCNSLVDRIVPGKPTQDILEQYHQELRYYDDYLIESEPFNLWAIEGSPEILNNWLSFAQCHEGIKITEDIAVFKELKLRLLNAAHSFSAGVALSAGLETVSAAMQNIDFQYFITDLMKDITVSIPMEIPGHVKDEFAAAVLDRFRNPNIRHFWSSITFNYPEKFKIRCVPLIQQYYAQNGCFSPVMVRGLGAYLANIGKDQSPVDTKDHLSTFLLPATPAAEIAELMEALAAHSATLQHKEPIYSLQS